MISPHNQGAGYLDSRRSRK